MPDLPQQNTIVQYQTNVAQLQYTFTFYAPLPGDIQVYYQAPNAIPVPIDDILSLNTDYMVTYNADPITGGIITLLFIPVTGYYLTINRQVAASLETNFEDARNFNGKNLDTALDRLLLLCQQNLNYILQRNLSYIINNYLPTSDPFLPNGNSLTQLPVLPTNYVWMGSGSGVVAALISTIPSASVLQSLLANNAPGTDGAKLVGYYDTFASNPTTVDAYLQALPTFIQNQINISSSSFKSGDMKDFAGTVIPSGWLACDGSAINRITYASLFAVIGTNWGVGDGSTTFNIPDCRRRTGVGVGGSGSGILGNTVGSVGGEENHVLTISELATHNHPGNATISVTTIGGGAGTAGTIGRGSGFGATDVIDPVATNNIGSNTGHNTIQPSYVVTKLIKI